jgi:hypothetical protein
MFEQLETNNSSPCRARHPSPKVKLFGKLWKKFGSKCWSRLYETVLTGIYRKGIKFKLRNIF